LIFLLDVKRRFDYLIHARLSIMRRGRITGYRKLRSGVDGYQETRISLVLDFLTKSHHLMALSDQVFCERKIVVLRSRKEWMQKPCGALLRKARFSVFRPSGLERTKTTTMCFSESNARPKKQREVSEPRPPPRAGSILWHTPKHTVECPDTVRTVPVTTSVRGEAVFRGGRQAQG
jgi:hypothetical protein